MRVKGSPIGEGGGGGGGGRANGGGGGGGKAGGGGGGGGMASCVPKGSGGCAERLKGEVSF